MSLSTHRDVSSISVESAELIYRSLSFENQLFTARVYKRNYRTPAIHSLLRRQVQTPPAVVPSIPLTSPDAFLSNIINTEPGFKAVHTVASTGDVSFMGVLLARGADVSETTSFERWTPLYLAARAGDLPMTELLVLKGADVNSRSFDGDQPIHAVSRCSDSGALEVVSLLLESGVDVNSPGLDSKRALHLAARSANLPLTKLLLGKGADIYSQGFHGDHPIHAASRCSDSTSLDVVGLLLEHGASVHDPNTYSVRPLQLATRHGNLSLARLLLENGADVNCHWSRCPCPDYPIHYASRLSNETSIGMVSLLMDYGAPVNDPNRYFEGPLHLAGQSGNLPLTKLLLERRADVNIKSIAGDQPLHATLRRSHTLTLEVASLLLEYGAAVDCPNKELERPLHLAVRMPQLRVAKLLLQKGADVNSRSRGSDQPIHMACRNRSLDMVEILLDYGANVNGKTIGGYQPLHVAATSGEQPSLIKLLVRKGAAIEAKSQGSFSQTALGLACINANIPNIRQLLVLYANACIEVPRAMLDVALEYRLPPVVDLLLEYGLDPNTAAASSDRTCWMDLLELANKPRETKYIVQSLIEHGADVRSTSQYGNQPLHYLALSRGRLEWNEDVKEMVDILLANGADLNALNVLGESPLLFAASRMDYGLTSYFLDKGATPLSSLPFFPSY